MTPEQHAHLAEIQEDFIKASNAKYRRGQAEHGGNLWERPVVTDLGDEIIDLVIYYHTVRNRINSIPRLVDEARDALSRGHVRAVEDALDIIYHLAR